MSPEPGPGTVTKRGESRYLVPILDGILYPARRALVDHAIEREDFDIRHPDPRPRGLGASTKGFEGKCGLERLAAAQQPVGSSLIQQRPPTVPQRLDIDRCGVRPPLRSRSPVFGTPKTGTPTNSRREEKILPLNNDKRFIGRTRSAALKNKRSPSPSRRPATMSFLFKALNSPNPSASPTATEAMAEARIRTPEEAGECSLVAPLCSVITVSSPPPPAMTACPRCSTGG